MATFPKLKTGAVAQYPASRSDRYATAVFRFVDGAQQHYMERIQPGRRWAIRLELLDDSEIAVIEEFFREQQGRAGSFAFEDPWDGTVYDNCSFDQDELALELQGEEQGGTTLTIRRNEA